LARIGLTLDGGGTLAVVELPGVVVVVVIVVVEAVVVVVFVVVVMVVVAFRDWLAQG